jgi:hypothetical protein
MCWLRILFAPATFSRLVADMLALAQLIQDHPEYGEQAIAVLESAQRFFPPVTESTPATPPTASSP